MKFEDIDNLWTACPGPLSRCDQGRLFAERAKVVLRAASANASLPRRNGRVDRKWLIERIGCRASAPSQNPALRQLLLQYDAGPDVDAAMRSIARDGGPLTPVSGAVPSEVDLEAIARAISEANPSFRRTHGDLVYTDATCRIGGNSYEGVPTLIWADGLDQAASDFFRDLVVKHALRPSTVKEYAKVLRSFLSRCRRAKRDWQTVDDPFLIAWRDSLRQRITVRRTNFCTDVVFRFYCWAEETRRLTYHVGIYDRIDLPADMVRHVFPISAKRKQSGSKHRSVADGWCSNLRLRSPRERPRNTPSEAETRALHTVALDTHNGERDSLLLSWAEETGARRSELVQLRVSDLPSFDQLGDLIECDKPWTINVTRKGNKPGVLHPLPDLIVRTWDYVEHGRRDIVGKWLDKEIVGYSEPKELFLSSKTGGVLDVDSITAVGRRLFRTVGIENANIHRLRAKFAVEVIEALLDAAGEGDQPVSHETVLIAAAQRMGHADPNSLRPYLNYVLQRRIRLSKAARVYSLEQKLRELELRESLLSQRVEGLAIVNRIADMIRVNRPADAVNVLSDLTAFLTRRTS